MADMPRPPQVHLIMDLSLRVGEVLIASGASAADVSATMQALARRLGLRHVDVDVTFTTLSMSHQPDPEEPPSLAVRHVKKRDLDYEDLTLVDQLVREVMIDDLELREARLRLNRIVSTGHVTPRWAITLGWGVMCAAVGVQFGGNIFMIVAAAIAGMSIDRLRWVLARRRIPLFYQQVAGGAIGALIGCGAVAVATQFIATSDPSRLTSQVISANIVMLLAGVGFMGGLHDALSGFYITATARMTEALLATAGIIAGVSAGLSLANLLGFRVLAVNPGQIGWETAGVTALGAAVAGAAFAFASYAPRRALLAIALVSGLAILIFQAVDQGFGRPWAAGIAAFFVGLVSYAMSGRVHVPPLVFVVSAVVPMLPGLSIYRGMALLAEGGSGTSLGLLSLFTAASVAMALAAGVLLGEYVAQPIRREARRIESRLSGPRLVGARLDPKADVSRRQRGEHDRGNEA